MATIMGVVPAVAPVFGGLITPVSGWRMNFTVAILCGLILTFVVAFRLAETPAAEGRPAALLRIDPARLPQPSGPSRISDLRDALDAGLWRAVRLHLRLVLRPPDHLRPRAARRSRSASRSSFWATSPARSWPSGSSAGYGLDGTIRLGVACLAAGGVLMVALVASGIGSIAAIIGPMTLYCAGRRADHAAIHGEPR